MKAQLRFGVATADHQCEAYDGRDDIRDVWERVRGLVARGKATDFWNRYREDVTLAQGLGCTAFRLSLSWARLEPEPGQWDDEAFAHYRDVLQTMRDAGMMTVVTLLHNTWPLHVQSAGEGRGLLDAAFPERMRAFASTVAQRLGDVIDYYVTINEPNQLVYGWIRGFWMRTYAMPPGQPPSMTADRQMDDVLTLIPNLFRAHAEARAAIRQQRPGAPVGTNPLVLGLPRWIQQWVDRNATHLRSPEQAKRQAARLSQSWLLEGGRVDLSLAQITVTHEREERTLFSEPYDTARPALLHARATPPPPDREHWEGRIGVVSDMLPASLVAGRFPAATVRYFDAASAAVFALRAGDLDAVFDDDVVLRQYANAELALVVLPGGAHHYAAAMAFGSRALQTLVDRALREYKREHRPDLTTAFNHKALAGDGSSSGDQPEHDRSLQRIRKRGVLLVGVHPGIPELCLQSSDPHAPPSQRYEGLEPDLARHIALRIFGSSDAVRFVPLRGDKRFSETRSWLQALFALRKSVGMFGTLLGTNWWNLGMAGKLPDFLCPRECAGTLDYVGVDYYWGVPSLQQMHRLSAAAECKYTAAPVWPGALDAILQEQAREFPGKPIIVIENGCVTAADGFTRAAYLEAHVREVRRAIERGVPVIAYLCWSITSNREWGLRFDDASDFGLYHIDLDTDPTLARIPTDASAHYARLIG